MFQVVLECFSTTLSVLFLGVHSKTGPGDLRSAVSAGSETHAEQRSAVSAGSETHAEQ
jgi:hypothetical protein